MRTHMCACVFRCVSCSILNRKKTRSATRRLSLSPNDASFVVRTDRVKLHVVLHPVHACLELCPLGVHTGDDVTDVADDAGEDHNSDEKFRRHKGVPVYHGTAAKIFVRRHKGVPVYHGTAAKIFVRRHKGVPVYHGTAAKIWPLIDQYALSHKCANYIIGPNGTVTCAFSSLLLRHSRAEPIIR